MALLDKSREPTPRELGVFGGLVAVFGGLIGMLAFYRAGSRMMPVAIWSVTLLLVACYYAVPPARRLVFHAWMTAVYPIGWLISHALLAGIYYLLITPIGVVMRLWGRDPLARSLDPSATTYWTPNTRDEEMQRYFQQF